MLDTNLRSQDEPCRINAEMGDLLCIPINPAALPARQCNDPTHKYPQHLQHGQPQADQHLPSKLKQTSSRPALAQQTHADQHLPSTSHALDQVPCRGRVIRVKVGIVHQAQDLLPVAVMQRLVGHLCSTSDTQASFWSCSALLVVCAAWQAARCSKVPRMLACQVALCRTATHMPACHVQLATCDLYWHAHSGMH